MLTGVILLGMLLVMRFLITKAATSSLLRAVLIAAYCLQCNILHIKGWFSPASRSRSSNQKRRAYDLVKTAFRFCSRLRRLRSAYDLVKTRLSESEAEAEEPNQSQNVGTCIVIALSFRFCFRLQQSGFHWIISGT